jgi:hypothetical protein
MLLTGLLTHGLRDARLRPDVGLRRLSGVA